MTTAKTVAILARRVFDFVCEADAVLWEGDLPAADAKGAQKNTFWVTSYRKRLPQNEHDQQLLFQLFMVQGVSEVEIRNKRSIRIILIPEIDWEIISEILRNKLLGRI